MTELDPKRWLERYGDLLFRYALARVGEVALAEDLVQETLLAAWRGRASFAGQASESTWLVGILKHKIADHFRRVAPDSLEALELDWERYFDERGRWREGPEDLSEPELEVELAQLKTALRRCIDDLPARFRHLFYLREIEGLSAEEICRQLPASSTNNVWVMLSRMRFKLRRCLAQAGFNRSGE